MIKQFLVLSSLLFISCPEKNNQDAINNLISFAKTYGYVKYFHPSDEASKIDWNYLSAYGAKRILECDSQEDMILTLEEIFHPIAPSVQFSETKKSYPVEKITPEFLNKYDPVYWQHNGVSFGMLNQRNTYKSVRANRENVVDNSDRFGNLSMSINAKKYYGKEIKFSGWAKLKAESKGTGHLWFRVDRGNNERCAFQNMNENPIKNSNWQQYEIYEEVCDDASRILIGSFMNGKGTLYLDDVQLSFKENNEWIEIPILNGDFEANHIGSINDESKWKGESKGYAYEISTAEFKEGKSSVAISYEGLITKTKSETIFDAYPKFGELIEKEIGTNLYCQIPLNLYGDSDNTFPKSSSYDQLENQLNKMSYSTEELHVRLGNVINTYNVFQHFYPYFDVVDIDWNMELETALKRSFEDKNNIDHANTLKKFTSPLKDGHISIGGGDNSFFVPNITWEWIENKLVITEVSDTITTLSIGDIVTRISGQSTKDYFNDIYTKISAGTDGYLQHIAKYRSLLGEEGSELIIEVNDEEIKLKRNQEFNYKKTGIAIQDWTHKLMEDNIYYLNLSKIEMDTITSLLPELQKAKGIVCDMRGYPNGNHDLISHLLIEKDTTTAWMQVPQIIYPDQENITGYKHHGWEMKPKTPYLGDKEIVFMIDGRAINYAESYMGFIDNYNLATIIGQPTAGTNGNVNPFVLLDKFRISWTGMKVVRHDRSQQHALGILPDIYVEKTIDGVKSGRDEFFEKAIEVIKK